MNPFQTISSRAVLLPRDNVDTDQIIPARFLKVTDKAGLGANLFADWRYSPAGEPLPGFPLNDPAALGAGVLVVGNNFGCGSSREHAPWALIGFGFRAIIATSFADIFRNNSIKNGLLPVAISPEAHQHLVGLLSEEPEAQVTIDLASQKVTMPDGAQTSFPIDPFSKTCLLNGTDELGYLLSFSDRISAYEQARENTPA
ncbi:MAG TPA: 3-isopropylmalate dehydratase small subunit [Anaerolineaceae bacterium]|nr:3-isopropylmalate dehydratase small subunit [Anaerolineaceae bacterium]